MFNCLLILFEHFKYGFFFKQFIEQNISDTCGFSCSMVLILGILRSIRPFHDHFDHMMLTHIDRVDNFKCFDSFDDFEHFEHSVIMIISLPTNE